MKMQKLYRIDLERAKGMRIGHFNPTCKAILKAMYKIEQQADEACNVDFKGTTGEDILKFAVANNLWATRQAPEKYHTTWAFYVKKLKEGAPVYESGALRGMSTEEYLGADDDLNEEQPIDPVDATFEDDEDEPQLMAAE